MAESVSAIDVYEPGTPRAAELLAAIAAKLGVERIEPGASETPAMVHLPMDWERAYELAEQALNEAGVEGLLIVRPLRPS